MIIPRHISLFGRLVDLANIDCHWFAFDATVWLYALSSLGLWLGMPWWPCGGCDDVPTCPACTEGASNIEFQVTLTGMADGSCSECEGLDGTYILEYSCEITGTCVWLGHMDVAEPCGGPGHAEDECPPATVDTPYVILTFNSGTIGVTFYVGSSDGTSAIPVGSFVAVVAGFDGDCESIDEEDLGLSAGGAGPCDPSGATVNVQALAV